MKNPRTISPGSAPALLVKVAGRSGISRFTGSFTIGRAPDNDLVVDNPAVSQHHAEVRFENGEWRLHDLGSTNGTIVGGEPVEDAVVDRALRTRLGFQGPAVLLTLEGADEGGAKTAVPSDSYIARRYFGRRDPKDMGALTAAFRRAFGRVHRKRARKYLVALALLTAASAGVAGYAYYLHQEVERQRAAAAELFYTAKTLELEIAELELTEAQRRSYRERREELDRQYRDFIQELGIYDDETPPEVQLIYRVAHRFGESEVNVPQEFVDEVMRFIERWKTTTRLEEAMERAHENEYGQRIAEIMLEHDLPPELFYLAVQESDLRLNAVGPETRFGIAKGMWQMIPGTARDYGLRMGPLVGVRRYDPRDERHDFEKATNAAARYLRRIYRTDAQASGLLVVASYNWGQTRVIRLIRSLPENPRQRNFWQLLIRYRHEIPRETYNYVFNIVSAAVIAEDPEMFGFDFEPPFARPGAGEEAVATAP